MAAIATANVHMDLFSILDAPITPDAHNVRLHNERNLKAIDTSLDEVGAGRSVVIDENGRILAGNGTMEVAKKRGMKVLIVDRPSRDTIIAVRVTDLDEREKTRLALWDNKAAELAKWDTKALQRLAQENPEQMLLGGVFDERELGKLLKSQEDAQPLAAGGAAEKDPELEGSAKQAVDQTKPLESQVRMVQLFLTVATQPAFVQRVRDLAKVLGTTTITDTVLAVVDRAAKEWVPAA